MQSEDLSHYATTPGPRLILKCQLWPELMSEVEWRHSCRRFSSSKCHWIQACFPFSVPKHFKNLASIVFLMLFAHLFALGNNKHVFLSDSGGTFSRVKRIWTPKKYLRIEYPRAAAEMSALEDFHCIFNCRQGKLQLTPFLISNPGRWGESSRGPQVSPVSTPRPPSSPTLTPQGMHSCHFPPETKLPRLSPSLSVKPSPSNRKPEKQVPLKVEQDVTLGQPVYNYKL